MELGVEPTRGPRPPAAASIHARAHASANPNTGSAAHQAGGGDGQPAERPRPAGDRGQQSGHGQGHVEHGGGYFEERSVAGAIWFRIGVDRWVHSGWVRVTETVTAAPPPAPVPIRSPIPNPNRHPPPHRRRIPNPETPQNRAG